MWRWSFSDTDEFCTLSSIKLGVYCMFKFSEFLYICLNLAVNSLFLYFAEYLRWFEKFFEN